MSELDPENTWSIDRAQLWALIRCYFRLSTRGKLSQTMRHGRSGKPRAIVWVIVMYVFVGMMMGAMAFTKVDVFTYSLLIHGMTFFVVGMAVTSESGDILFNANESDVLVHRPIHPRTLLLAKSLNLICFTLILAGALNLFPTFLGLLAVGALPWFPVVHIVSVIFLSICCSAAVVCLYGVIVRFFDREKFDNFAVWSQVAMSILFTVGYQVLPRMMGRFKGLNLESYANYLLPLPPAWFASMDALLSGGQINYSSLLLAGIGVFSTLILGYTAIGKLAPSYGEALAKLSETGNRIKRPRRVRNLLKRNRNSFLRWWLRDPIEWSTFRLLQPTCGAIVKLNSDFIPR